VVPDLGTGDTGSSRLINAQRNKFSHDRRGESHDRRRETAAHDSGYFNAR